MCSVHKVAWVLLVISGLNWGIIGIANLNVVNLVLGGVPVIERIVYILVGLSALSMFFCGKCKKCMTPGK